MDYREYKKMKSTINSLTNIRYKKILEFLLDAVDELNDEIEEMKHKSNSFEYDDVVFDAEMNYGQFKEKLENDLKKVPIVGTKMKRVQMPTTINAGLANKIKKIAKYYELTNSKMLDVIIINFLQNYPHLEEIQEDDDDEE